MPRPLSPKKEMKECNYCHVNPGGPRNFRGRYYKAHGLSFATTFDNIYEARIAGVADANAMGPDAKATVADVPQRQNQRAGRPEIHPEGH